MAKKLKKAKKAMSPRTKNILINSFKGIISNQACVDNGKEAPWWLAILFLLFSVIIPLIPNHVQLANSYGASFLNSGTFGIDVGLARASVQLKKDGQTLNVEGGNLTYSGTGELNPIYSYTNPLTGQYTFMMYYTEETGSAFTSFVNVISKTQYTVGTTTVYDKETAGENDTPYVPTFVVLSKKTLAAATYKENSIKLVGSTTTGLNWNNTKKGDLVERALAKFTDDIGNPITDFSSFNLDTISLDNVKAAYKAWTGVFNETYVEQRDKTKWTNTGIYAAVYAGLMFFLGLMVFILTRGKNNPNSSLNFWICQKISYFLGFTPAVLALIIGFIFSGNIIGQMGFIMLLSLRTMWASMRQLRPVQY